jgi:hypothetical protein
MIRLNIIRSSALLAKKTGIAKDGERRTRTAQFIFDAVKNPRMFRTIDGGELSISVLFINPANHVNPV